MSAVLAAVCELARRRPSALALVGDTAAMSYGELAAATDSTATQLDGCVIGLLVDNGPSWVVLDLATHATRAACVPLPAFFSDAQLRHVLDIAGVDLVVTDQPARIEALLGRAADGVIVVAGKGLAVFRRGRDPGRPTLDAAIAKVSFTSGTTGQPKGVCLRQSTIDTVAETLCRTLVADVSDRSLCVLPLATLLENIGGVYVPLLAGATSYVTSQQRNGLLGATGVDIGRLTSSIDDALPTSMILVPQLLQALVIAIRGGWSMPRSLRYVAVGGAPVAPRLLNEAEWLGLPVYEGYGLSEACSVVSLNRPTRRRLGTVGEVLPHAQVVIADDGEIWVGGALFDGYLGEPPLDDAYWPTGDTGMLDDQGFLTITGRKKSAYATAFGRNVMPEWVEREMIAQPAIEQIAVFGEARPFNVAVVFSRSPRIAVERAIDTVNGSLPDYARVQGFVLTEAPFTPQNGLLTVSGKLRRAPIWDRYRSQLESRYRESRHVVSR